jgi:hypothetical protein
MARPFVILSVGSILELELLKTRGLILRREGYVVASVDSIASTISLFSHTGFHFDLLILSHTIPYAERNRVAQLCKKMNPSARILVLVSRLDCDPQADGCIDPQEGPQALLEKVASLLKKGAQKERRNDKSSLREREEGSA